MKTAKCLMDISKSDIEIRFWSKVAKTNACWVWEGATNGRGYGRFTIGRHARYQAHRVSWYLAYGNIPDRMVILHTCDNTRCVNPDHLRLGTQHDNLMDMSAKGRHGRVDSYGELNGEAKLTQFQVDEMRLIYSLGGSSYTKLMARYHMSKSQIARIIHGESWKR